MGNKQQAEQQNNSNNNQKSGLVIKSFTWKKDSHSLFDYESLKQIKKDILPISTSCSLYRVGDELRQEQVNEIHTQIEQLFNINTKGNSYFFYQDAMKTQNVDGLSKNSAWIVVRSLSNIANSAKSQIIMIINAKNNLGFQLSVNDYFKLGRVRFRVKEICGKNQSTNSKAGSSQGGVIADQCADNEEFPGENKESCRICLQETQTKKNRFISPCLCSGSVATVHEECLQIWLKSKINCKETPIHSYYSMKNLQCELCKFKYTEENTFIGNSIENVLITKPSCPYIMLEILSKEKNLVRGIQLVKYDNINKIVFGRGSDSDIRISDISVSREHAIIRLEDNRFIIEDQKSKFGTLILVRNPIELSPAFNKVEVQIGRSVCLFQVKKQSSFFGSLCSGKGSKKNDIINTTVISKVTQAELGDIPEDEEHKNDFQDHEEGNRIEMLRGGAYGARRQFPDTIVNMLATEQQIQNPQTSDDLNRVEDINFRNQHQQPRNEGDNNDEEEQEEEDDDDDEYFNNQEEEQRQEHIQEQGQLELQQQQQQQQQQFDDGDEQGPCESAPQAVPKFSQNMPFSSHALYQKNQNFASNS